MKATVVNIVIERDPMTKIPKQVRPWEVPLFRLQYGDDKVLVGEAVEVEMVDSKADPDPTEEYMRLRQNFGIEPDTKQSIADIAYGRGQQGIDNLEKAIKAASKGKAEKSIDGPQLIVDQAGNPKAKPSPDAVEAREQAVADPLDAVVEQSNNSVIGAAAGGPGDVSGDAKGNAKAK